MREHQSTVPIDPRVAEGYSSANALRFALRGVILGLLIVAIVAVTLAYRATAAEPRTTYTASATQLVITYGAGADSIDVNVRYPDGTSTNYHPNRAAAVGEVLTLPLTGRPAWVQAHSTNCHLGEPGSPGHGTDCRFIEEEPWPTTTPTTPTGPTAPPVEPSPEPTVEPTEDPSPTPTGTPSPSTAAPSTSATTGPSPAASADPAPGALPATEYRSEVSAVEERAATASPRELAATGTDGRVVAVAAVTAVVLGAYLLAFGRRLRR